MKKLTQIQWTVEQASTEFDINPRTLSKRLKQLAIEPAFEDGKFSTHQIVSAVFGDIDSEKLRKTRNEADLLEVELAEKRSKLVDVEIVFRYWENIAVAIRQIVKNSSLSQVEKEECLKNIRELKVDDITRIKTESEEVDSPVS